MKQNISVLMDGELEDQAAGELIDALARDREALEVWRTYQLIGDALRENPPLSEGFGAKLARQLAAEPTVIAPGRLQPQPRTWYALAASVAAVALVGWLGFTPQQPPAPVATAPLTAQPVAQAKPALVPLPSGTNDYLLAHQGFSPRVSLQGMAPYVRTVSEQGREPRK
jgi:sigma-E factor negative regulatory protein RseA